LHHEAFEYNQSDKVRQLVLLNSSFKQFDLQLGPDWAQETQYASRLYVVVMIKEGTSVEVVCTLMTSLSTEQRKSNI